MTPQLRMDAATVTLDALQRATYALADRMSVDLRQDGVDWLCTLLPRAATTVAEDLEELEHLWRREVTDQVLRLRIAEQTEGVRNLIFAAAFSRTGLVDPPDPA